MVFLQNWLPTSQGESYLNFVKQAVQLVEDVIVLYWNW